MNVNRNRDVIDVNRIWDIYRGDREFSVWIGSVRAPDRLAARAAAREAHTGRLIVEEQGK